MTDVPAFPAAERWAERLAGWAVPQRVLDQAPADPWTQDPARFAVGPDDRRTRSASWAREVLPPLGGTVLDVGCGGGRASLALVPPATEVVGVDRRGAMLDEFVAAAARLDVARRTVHGEWPEVASVTPSADVAVCHHVLYDVADLAPFVLALTARARLAVVVELATIHPMTALAPAWRHFWDLERPSGPGLDDLLAVLRELGLDPEWTVSARAPRAGDATSPAELAPRVCRRLCLPADREAEVAEWLADHPVPWPERMATLRWPGASEG